MNADPYSERLAFAPAAIVRAALFPLSRLLGLADPTIAHLAAIGREADPGAYTQAYDGAIERQRGLLAQATLADPAFMRALTVTNPMFARRAITNGPLAPVRNKKVRHVETSLYRYLARAVWRTEPCDLWAGVALVEWGNDRRVSSTCPRYAFAPDLRPFVAMIRRLAHHPRYRADGHYFTNPTLERSTGSAWRYTARMEGAIFEREIAGSSGIDGLLEALADFEPAPIPRLVARLADRGFRDARLPDILTALIDAGILVGGLGFPHRFGSAWAALRITEARLMPCHARAWREARRTLRRLCRSIETTLDTMTVAQLLGVQDEVRAVILALAADLGVDTPDLPRAPLRCDTHLPFAVTLGEDDRRYWAQASEELENFEAGWGLDPLVRAAHRQAILRDPHTSSGSTPGRGATLEAACAALDDPLLARRVAEWSSWIAGDGRAPPTPDQSDWAQATAPVGALLVRPSAGLHHVLGSTSEIASLYGRYWPIWVRSGSMATARGLHRWYSDALTTAGASAGISIVEYVGPCDDAPNGLAHPHFGHTIWDRWDPGASRRRRYEIPWPSGRPLAFEQAAPDGPVSIHCFSPLNLGYSEPRLARLLLSSFRELPGWLAPGLPFAAELQRDGVSPGIRVADQLHVRERRSLLRGEWLARFRGAGRPERFQMWQQIARSQCWPSLVLLGRGSDPPIPVVRDSPLALEAAIEGLAADTMFLTVILEEPATWLQSDNGERYVTEFSFPYTRSCHAWSDLAAS